MKVREKKSAADAAYSYLDSRMRTRYEVEKYLADKGYDPEEITETVNDLIGMRYIDDYQYALRYYEYNREKHRGSSRAARELAGRGVDPETIKYAREDFLYSGQVDEYADALELAEKELDPGDKVDQFDDRLAAKIARKLNGRGYEHNDIFRVLDELRRRYTQ